MTYCIYCEREPNKYEYFLNRVCLQCYKIAIGKARAEGTQILTLELSLWKWWKAAKREKGKK